MKIKVLFAVLVVATLLAPPTWSQVLSIAEGWRWPQEPTAQDPQPNVFTEPPGPPVDRPAAWPGEPLSVWLTRPREEVRFLEGDWHLLLQKIEELGSVGVVSGNSAIRHFAVGSYAPYRIGVDAWGAVEGEGIDLRVLPKNWAYAAAELPVKSYPAGFAFFDESGALAQRIILPDSSLHAFRSLVEEFYGSRPEFVGRPIVEAATRDTTVPGSISGLLDAWALLKDEHDFEQMLSLHNVSRLDALKAAEGKFTERLDLASFPTLFLKLVLQQVPISVFTVNSGCVQISTGTLAEVNVRPGLLDLKQSDNGSTLISLSRIAEAWRVSKPTSRGTELSLELYGSSGEPLAYFFGSRNGREDAIAKWRETLSALSTSATVPK